tara:strand:- start:447 stop:977 length:531 start_codon:yes stop_codon:yes gene_type:complete
MRREQGFTVIEILVVMAIVVLMTILVLPNWRAGEQSLALQRSAQKLAQDTRRAQELALRAQSFTCQIGTISGYGIFFDQSAPNSYILFAECNGNNTYNDGIDGIVDGESISLESGVEIASVTPGPTVSIVFIPPTPTIWINNDVGQTSVQVVLRRTGDPASTKTITITNKGIIDVD